ncbi:LON peptidase substrate-binding domain-containing protein [Aquisalimonas asiatica]|uniref:Lon N-terminal domain-containing protein n=1 Tax=Aquisalimonas asiatica TaxID=406100 RepID=A0A1H8TR85_9GAMM|nr:LON peptidase substrate-binding domain-containing protein [Aquisalimonas asiatica]SEO93540.1 hypothetical protein SAMN04488052_104413 [Aquisalimonas asiatica]
MSERHPKTLQNIPIFPLRTVLFPGGPIPLRIFEPRYLDMISRCLRTDSPFGVCLIREGREVGGASTPHPLGTLARIVDWEQGKDGLLAILALGGDRFEITETWLAPNRLRMADVLTLPAPEQITLPPQPDDIVELLDRVMAMTSLGYQHCTRRDQDAEWLGGRLAELMPVTLERKQQLLAMHDPLERLQALQELLPQLRLPA